VGKHEDKMKLPLKVKLYLKDGRSLFFEEGKVTITPFAVTVTEKDKPDITKFFPWGNIRELELPIAVEEKKVIQPGQVIGVGG